MTQSMKNVMNKRMNDKAFDRELKNRLQRMESDIPPEIEDSVLEGIRAINPLELLDSHDAVKSPRTAHPAKNSRILFLEIAAAASILIAALLFFFPLFQGHPPAAEAEEIVAQDATLEGKPAFTITVKSNDPDFTVIWVEPVNKDLNDDKNKEINNEISKENEE